MNPILDLSIAEASARISRRELSAAELTEATLQQIGETEPLVHAYATVIAESALEEARRIDAELARGVWRGDPSDEPMRFFLIVSNHETANRPIQRVQHTWNALAS